MSALPSPTRKIRHDDQAGFEPGILPVFRGFSISLFVLTGLGVCGMVNDPTPNIYNACSFVLYGVLALCLSARPLQRRLPATYMKVAVWLAALGPILNVFISNRLIQQQGLTAVVGFVEPSQPYLSLIFALLIISAQYGMRSVLLFSIGGPLLEILLALPFIRAGLDIEAVGTQAFIRFILFTFSGYIVARISTAQRTQRLELAKKNAQLTHYAATLEQLAVARERNRLARELHDTLAHTLSAVNMQLNALDVLWESDPIQARQTLTRTQELTRTGLHESRRALQSLRASLINELGLGLALRQLATRTAERANLKLTLAVPEQITGLRPEVEQNLFRIAEEAITNVARHAQASRLELSLSLARKENRLHLRVRDDGRGFDLTAQTPDGHYGLVGIRERTLLLNGELALTSAPGQGTSIDVQIPITEASP